MQKFFSPYASPAKPEIRFAAGAIPPTYGELNQAPFVLKSFTIEVDVAFNEALQSLEALKAELF